jgi:acetyl-CoA carboxylase biotin carboxyl carrier protein
MELTEEDVLEILRLIEESDFEYFELRSGDLNLTVSKGGYAPAGHAAAPLAPPQPPQRREEPAAAEAPAPEGPARGPADRDGLAPIVAPMVGTFYRAPEPGAAPFVEVGAPVEADTTVGLVEVMKVFTSIPAGTAGTIAEVVAGNAEFVEKGAVLFYVTPGAA